MQRVCITGGAGFVASHLADSFCSRFPLAEIIVVDKIGYASRRDHLAAALGSGQVRLIEASICDQPLMRNLLKGVDLVVHAAAESHVDNSYRNVVPFLESNIAGTVTLLQAAIDNNVRLFLHLSTDEVYGGADDHLFLDNDALAPTNPYAASKASAEMFVHCYSKSYMLPTIISRANNIFGPRQYPEKLVPKLICDALRGEKFKIHGNGSARRSFLHVRDFCGAVVTLVTKGEPGQVYNVPGACEHSVMEVVELVGRFTGRSCEQLAEPGLDRPFNDSRYGVVADKLLALGWHPEATLEAELPGLIDWYAENLHLYFDAVSDGAVLAAEGGRPTSKYVTGLPR